VTAALVVALAYVVVGTLWITLSDRIALELVRSPEQLARLQSVKGLTYVAVTALLLFALVYRLAAALERRNVRLRRHRDHLLELNRVQALVRAVNSALLRIDDEELLLREACRATVREGGFVYAWIGLVRPDGRHLARMAEAGGQGAHRASLALPLDDSANGSIIARALRDGQPHMAAAHADAWVDTAAGPDLEYGGVIALPLRANGVAGVLVIHGADAEQLARDNEQRLLCEVADNMALGIGYLRQQQTLHRMTYHDELTGVGNRRLVENRLMAAIGNAEARRGAVGVIVLDVDRFRETNDTGGRAAGDRVLQATAQILSGVTRPGDTVGRLGNDEFAIVFADLPSTDLVGRLVGRVADRFPERLDIDGLEIYLTLSMGVAIYPQDGTDAQELIAHAELALHSQEEDRAAMLTYYAPEFDARARQRRTMEQALRNALAQDEFELAWQPIVDIASRTAVGAEVLLRWDNPQLGSVTPDRFIPVAEQTGLILPIGTWVTETACAQADAWAAAGRPIDVAVNMALQQLQDPDFVGQVRRVLSRYPPRGWRLILELTESEFMADPDPVIAACRALKDMGCAIHVDDFGTGYSALNYLTQLPIDGLKIDRSFVARVESDRGVRAVTQAVLALAGSLQLDVIAEGVETKHQLEVVRELGCTQVQGFLFGRPMPAESVVTRFPGHAAAGGT